MGQPRINPAPYSPLLLPRAAISFPTLPATVELLCLRCEGTFLSRLSESAHVLARPVWLMLRRAASRFL